MLRDITALCSKGPLQEKILELQQQLSRFAGEPATDTVDLRMDEDEQHAMDDMVAEVLAAGDVCDDAADTTVTSRASTVASALKRRVQEQATSMVWKRLKPRAKV